MSILLACYDTLRMIVSHDHKDVSVRALHTTDMISHVFQPCVSACQRTELSAWLGCCFTCDGRHVCLSERASLTEVLLAMCLLPAQDAQFAAINRRTLFRALPQSYLPTSVNYVFGSSCCQLSFQDSAAGAWTDVLGGNLQLPVCVPWTHCAHANDTVSVRSVAQPVWRVQGPG